MRNYQQRGGKVHPNGPLQTKPWGHKRGSAADWNPNGVCVNVSRNRMCRPDTSVRSTVDAIRVPFRFSSTERVNFSAHCPITLRSALETS